jgi:hypothetical protein
MVRTEVSGDALQQRKRMDRLLAIRLVLKTDANRRPFMPLRESRQTLRGLTRPRSLKHELRLLF